MDAKSLMSRLSGLADSARTEVGALRLALRHPRTPVSAKVFLVLAVIYAFLPFDLIPDFIPVLGQLDDIIIIPLLAGIGLWLIPRGVMEECRFRAGLTRRRL